MTVELDEKLKTLPDEFINCELWLRGDLEHLLRPYGQHDIYQFVHYWRSENPSVYGPLVIEAHRRLGKSMCLLILAIEEALKAPGRKVRYGGPLASEVQQLVHDNLNDLMRLAPQYILDNVIDAKMEKILISNPRWAKGSRKSEISIFGINRDSIESVRGLGSDMVIVDEVGFLTDPGYAINDVLLYQLLGRRDAIMILSSTPPRSIAHPWCTEIVPKSEIEGRYIKRNAENNPFFTGLDRQAVLTQCGGEDTTSWKREALCEHCSDSEFVVVPEFSSRKKDIVQEWQKPPYCFQLVAGDFGFKDCSAILFSYIDFSKQKWIIEDEVVVHYKTTKELASMVNAKEEELCRWLDAKHEQPRPLLNQLRRIADATPQQLADFTNDYSLPFEAAEKYDRDAGIADLRTAFQNGKIILSSKCKCLIRQLEAGVFNTTRRDFERQIGEPADGLLMGHLDAIAALSYGWRAVKNYFHFNPFPNQWINPADHFVRGRQSIGQPGAVFITRTPLNVTHNPI